MGKFNGVKSQPLALSLRNNELVQELQVNVKVNNLKIGEDAAYTGLPTVDDDFSRAIPKMTM